MCIRTVNAGLVDSDAFVSLEPRHSSFLIFYFFTFFYFFFSPIPCSFLILVLPTQP